MSNREKIIVSIMLIAIGYAVYALYLAPVPPRTAKTATGANVARELASRLNQELSRLELNAAERQIVQLSEQPWAPDPFLDRLPVMAKTANQISEPKAKKVDDRGLKYTGYIEVGNNHMAIINDMEYEVNDEVENTPYVVKRIKPGRVMVEDKNSKESFWIPFAEDVFVPGNGNK